LTNIIKTFALVVSASIIGAVGVNNLSPSSIVANELYVEAYETGVHYFCSLSEFDENITIELKNDFTNRVEKVVSTQMDGCFENLAPNMKYTFFIKHGSKIIVKKDLITKTSRQSYNDQESWNSDDNYGRDKYYEDQDDYDNDYEDYKEGYDDSDYKPQDDNDYMYQDVDP